MTDLYTSEQYRLQESFGTQELAAAHKALIVTEEIPEADKGRAENEGGTITAEEYMEKVLRGEP